VSGLSPLPTQDVSREWVALVDSVRILRSDIHAFAVAALREHDQEHSGVARYCRSHTCRMAHRYLVHGRAA
jgi:hypothetical protein